MTTSPSCWINPLSPWMMTKMGPRDGRKKKQTIKTRRGRKKMMRWWRRMSGSFIFTEFVIFHILFTLFDKFS